MKKEKKMQSMAGEKIDKAIAREISSEAKKLGKDAVRYLRKHAIKNAGSYDRGHNIGQIIKALGLGGSWAAGEKFRGKVLSGLKRAEELGLVAVRRRGSPMTFKYIGDDLTRAEDLLAKKQRARMENLLAMAKKLKIKDLNIHSGDAVSMSTKSFIRLAAKVGVS